MTTIDHEIALTGYSATPSRLLLGTAGSHGIERIVIATDEHWDGCAITATFTANGTSTVMAVNSEGWCAVPPEATEKTTATGKLVLAGMKDGACIISCDVLYRVIAHGAASGSVSTATPSEYEQWLANIQGVETDMKAWVEKTLSDFTVEKLDIDTATDSEVAAIFDGDAGTEQHFVDVPRLATFKTLQDAANLDLYPSDAVTAAQIDSYFA